MTTYTILIIALIIFIYLLFSSKDYLTVNLYFLLIIKRGIIYPTKLWWKLNNILMGKHGLTTYYYMLKNKYAPSPVIQVQLMNTPLKLIVDINLVHYMLHHSPKIFGPGSLKIAFFEYFMPYNLGISKGINWAHRRIFNESILDTPQIIHYDCALINSIKTIIDQESENHRFECLEDFMVFSKRATSRIVLGCIYQDIYKLFRYSSDISSLAFPKTGNRDPVLQELINNDISQEYCLLTVMKNIQGVPCDVSIYDQVPHWIFPMNGSLSILLEKMIYFVINHQASKEAIMELCYEPFNLVKLITHKYLEWNILEVLRLNNPVVTFFREVLKDHLYESDTHSYNFYQGEQLLVLSSPILKDPIIFTNPHAYIPERWNDPKVQKYSLIFGMGPQICPGQNIIKLILKIGLYYVLNKREFKSLNYIDLNDVSDMIDPYSIYFTTKERYQ
jgi:hypothetical protein